MVYRILFRPRGKDRTVIVWAETAWQAVASVEALELGTEILLVELLGDINDEWGDGMLSQFVAEAWERRGPVEWPGTWISRSHSTAL